MREASKLERSSLGLNPKSKYYIVPEGDKTEIQYFLGIRNNAKELNINPLLEILLIENDDKEKGHSHPKKKLQNFKKDLDNGKFLYDEEIDKVFFVIDRDPQNFSIKQYFDFLKECQILKFNVCVSNPTFELFLLMHSDEILKIDKNKMLENRKVNKNKRFLEVKLAEIFKCNKININFIEFKNNLYKAIKMKKYSVKI